MADHTAMTTRYRDIERLVAEFESRRDRIRERLRDFAAVPPEEYLYELVYCLLTPQSSAVNAGKTVDALRSAGLSTQDIKPAPILFRKAHYIRFHNTKAHHILEAKRHFPEIAAMLSNGCQAEELRAWLVRNVNGLGWKEASHFLRNIGYRNLAILDRHILRNLRHHGVIRSLPKTLTPHRYAGIEARFRRFADDIGISMDELDLLFWSRETGEILK